MNLVTVAAFAAVTIAFGAGAGLAVLLVIALSTQGANPR